MTPPRARPRPHRRKRERSRPRPAAHTDGVTQSSRHGGSPPGGRKRIQRSLRRGVRNLMDWPRRGGRHGCARPTSTGPAEPCFRRTVHAGACVEEAPFRHSRGAALRAAAPRPEHDPDQNPLHGSSHHPGHKHRAVPPRRACRSCAREARSCQRQAVAALQVRILPSCSRIRRAGRCGQRTTVACQSVCSSQSGSVRSPAWLARSAAMFARS
jgi:hypothetical protein